MPRWLKSFVVGFGRRWKSGVVQAFGVMGAIWLPTEVITRASVPADQFLDRHGDAYLIIVGAASLLWFLFRIYERRSVEFCVPTTACEITIEFGDIFDRTGDLLIGVNEFFDGELGQVISENSVHGQVIRRFYQGDANLFRAAIDPALAGYAGKTTKRATDPKVKYPIGTTPFVSPAGGDRIFLLAMAHTHLTTHKASTTIPILWEALMKGLRTVHANNNGAPLSMPLIGNGRASVNIEPQHLLRLIVLALVHFTRGTAMTKVAIIVPEECFTKLDLQEIKRDWSGKNGL